MSRAILPQHEALLASRLDADETDRREVTAAVLKMLEEDRRLAYSTKQPAVAVSASVAIAKIFDLFEGSTSVSPVTVIISAEDAGVC